MVFMGTLMIVCDAAQLKELKIMATMTQEQFAAKIAELEAKNAALAAKNAELEADKEFKPSMTFTENGLVCFNASGKWNSKANCCMQLRTAKRFLAVAAKEGWLKFLEDNTGKTVKGVARKELDGKWVSVEVAVKLTEEGNGKAGEKSNKGATVPASNATIQSLKGQMASLSAEEKKQLLADAGL